MKIGLISDIHGNQQALTKVLSELYSARVDLILCAGDLVCYGAQCNQVLELLRSCAIPSVVGNYPPPARSRSVTGVGGAGHGPAASGLVVTK